MSTARVLSRRDAMRSGLAGLSVWAMAQMTPRAFGLMDPPVGEEVVPFLDPLPEPKRAMLRWDQLAPGEWVTPTPKVFDVSHYGKPEVKAEGYQLKLSGLVEKPVALSLDQIKARPKKELIATLECSGNGSGQGFMGAIGNARWAGTPLKPLLDEAGLKPAAVEVAFYGSDKGKEKVGDAEVEQRFARTLSVQEAQRDDLLLCYEMNGEPLSVGHGFPLRLIVPGWYGIAWVKWLGEIELRDERLATRFIARDYVTLRIEEKDGKQVSTRTPVGPMNVKSIVARVTRKPNGPVTVSGAAWTQGKVKKVEVQVNGGEWVEAKLDAAHADAAPHTWTFWTYEWKDAKPGEHRIVSRATDERGRVQPTKEDAEIKTKKTYYEAYAQYPRRVKL